MYEELINLLRNCATQPAPCGTCCMISSQNCSDLLMEQAADTIEELFGRDTNVPRWIPVTERLPEKHKYVLVRYKNNDMAVACWFDGDEDILFWRAMTDEGWCSDCDTDPTHWTPLPEPPKEGTE